MGYITGGLGIALTTVMLIFFGKALLGKDSQLKNIVESDIKSILIPLSNKNDLK